MLSFSYPVIATKPKSLNFLCYDAQHPAVLKSWSFNDDDDEPDFSGRTRTYEATEGLFSGTLGTRDSDRLSLSDPRCPLLTYEIL